MQNLKPSRIADIEKLQTLEHVTGSVAVIDEMGAGKIVRGTINDYLKTK